jgi:hypothetical protein
LKKFLLLFSLFWLKQVDAQVCFSSPVTYSTVLGTDLASLTTADFNGDGKLDLASANGSSSKIFIFLNTGAGNFGTAISFTLAPNAYPNSITNADFNGDGFIDLVTANNDASTNCVSLLLGNGAGSFGSPTNYTISTTPNLIISEDFNGDSNADLAISDRTSNNVSILLGTGVGSFGTPTTFSVNSNPYTILSADFNRDGKKDLIAGNNNVLSVLLGTGTGSFSAPINSAVLYSPSNPITISDFNGDTILDIAAADYSNWTSSVYVIFGNGTGGFANPQGFNNSSDFPVSISSADYNGDGKNDVVASYGNAINLSVFLGDGTGNFSLTGTMGSQGTDPRSLLNADFNSDNIPDIAVGNTNESDVTVFLNCINTIGIGDLSYNKEQIIISPNPNTGQFSIETNSTKRQSVKVFDVNGRIVLSQHISGNASIDATNLDEGIYTLTISSSEHTVNKKLVIVR